MRIFQIILNFTIITFLLYRKFNGKCESIDAIARSDWWIEQYNPTVEERSGFRELGSIEKPRPRLAKEKTWKNLLIFNRNVPYENAKQAIFAPVYTWRVRLSGKWQRWNDHFKCECSNGSSPFDAREIFYLVDVFPTLCPVLPDLYLKTDQYDFQQTIKSIVCPYFLN